MKPLLSLLLFITCFNSFCQVAINTNGSAPDASAMLDVTSASRGMLAPRMTTAQRNAINSPAKGLTVYDSTTNSFWVFKSPSWTELVSLNLPFAAVVNSPNAFPGAAFRIVNTNSTAGSAGTFIINNATNSGSALSAASNGTGNAFRAEVSANAANAIFAHTTGSNTGTAGLFTNDNGANNAATIFSSTEGDGYAGVFSNTKVGATNSGAIFASVSADTGTGYPNAILARASGRLSTAGFFSSTDENGVRPTFVVQNNGLERAVIFQNQNVNNAADVMEVYSSGTSSSRGLLISQQGLGMGAEIQASNATNSSDVLNVNNISAGTSFHAQNNNALGNGAASVFEKQNPFTGIYTTSANADLEVRHPNGGTAGMGGLRILNKGANNNAWTLFTENATGNLILYANGVLKGSFNATTGIYTPPSDARLKSAVATMPDVLANVMKLQPKTYYYTADTKHRMTLGFLAQEVEPLFPQAVYKNIAANGDETYSMDYSAFGVIAVKAVQEEHRTINQQQQLIDAQQKQIDELKKEIAGIKQAMQK